MSERITIGLDYSHNNPLILETSSYNDFIEFLMTSNYQLSKIETGFFSIDILDQYDVLILPTPINSKLEERELENLEEFVKFGGSLLIFSSSGGDFSNNTNLNDLTKKFGFRFNSDEVQDSMNFVVLQKRMVLDDITPHAITEQVNKTVFSNACSLEILEEVTLREEIKLEELIRGGLNCWRKVLREKEWVEEDCPKIPLLVASEYHEGRVVGFGTVSIFSSLGREYGFTAFNNNNLIANILRWLTLDIITEEKVINLNLSLEMYTWLNDLLTKDNWASVSDVISVALRYFKDNYKIIMDQLRRIEVEKVKTKIILENEGVDDQEIKIDEKILRRIPGRKKEDLEDILSSLGAITGENYELSEEFKELEKKAKKKKISILSIQEDNKVDLVDKYYEEDIHLFEEETGKKAIWQGRITNAFKEWIEEKYKK